MLSTSLSLGILDSTMISSTICTRHNVHLPMMIRCYHNCPSYWNQINRGRNRLKMIKNGVRTNISAAASASSHSCGDMDSSLSGIYQEVIDAARKNFTQEISFQSNDKDISLTKVLLYIAAEDEAFLALNNVIDSCSFLNERKDIAVPPATNNWNSLDDMPLAGKCIAQWLHELDSIAKEVEAELTPRDIGCYIVEVLEAVNVVLFELRGFNRTSVLTDPKSSYLHSVLNTRCGSGILLSVIYIEVCRRLGLTIVGSRLGEDFLIWPQMEYPEELFRVKSTSGHSLFAVLNGRCVEDPRSRASELTSESLKILEIDSNRDIIEITLANLIRLHWKRASRANHGLMLTSPIRFVLNDNPKSNKTEGLTTPLLRPRDLRLLILRPHNWSLRRDYGLMLYYNRDYASAVQELSICMAFAPEEEAKVLEPFIEKLHLMRLASTWKSLGQIGQIVVS